MRILVITLLLTSTFAQAEVFKTINPDGSVSYSDVQSEGAKPITPPGLTSTPAVKLPEKTKTKPEDKTQAAAPYTIFKIVSPTRDQTIRSNIGDVKVSIDMKPELQKKFKHTISILLDGRVVASKLNSQSHTLKNVFRGRHSISAKIIDKNGKALKSSNQVFLNVRRFSKLNKEQIDKRQTQPENDTDSESETDSQPDNNTQPSDPQNPWPSLPDYSKPQNVWPSLPNTPPPGNSQ